MVAIMPICKHGKGCVTPTFCLVQVKRIYGVCLTWFVMEGGARGTTSGSAVGR